jgi:hypothetical protein
MNISCSSHFIGRKILVVMCPHENTLVRLKSDVAGFGLNPKKIGPSLKFL